MDEKDIEIERLTHALQVCEFTLGRKYPTRGQQTAAMYAASAYRKASGWQPVDVWDLIPSFMYYKGPEYTERTIGFAEVNRAHCIQCDQFPELKADGTFKFHLIKELSTRRGLGPSCPASGERPAGAI